MIESIDFKLVGHTEKRVQIALKGKNIIITGGNGCGKTRFLRQLHQHLEDVFERNIESKERTLNDLQDQQVRLSKIMPSDQWNDHYTRVILEQKENLQRLDDEILVFQDNETLFELHNSKQLLLRFFEAHRLASNIASNGQINSMSAVKESGKNEEFKEDSSNKFEVYLVSYYNYGSHVIAREKNPEKEQQISDWFKKVEHDLRSLFEDPQLRLEYNPEEQAFYIEQNGKDPFRFNNLSSGYSSILSIYADLLMKVELREIPSDELTGFVFIDEIDAHLHVSIQRKIFSFFDKAFPKIQFIVTTHSPFVVQSVNDAIIYDLSKMECLEDLSMYSYESILKGLLGVESTSDILNENLDKMAQLINEAPLNKEQLKELIESIEPYEKQLNARSRAFLLLGKNALLDLADREA